MRGGGLRHLVSIQRVGSTSINSFGESSDSWSTLAQRHASIQPLTGRERFSAAQAQSDVSHKIGLRADSVTRSLTPKDRIAYGSRVFNIRAVLNKDERNREIEILATEVVNSL